MKTRHTPKIALVHDWLVSVRGGERVFTHICETFPDADVYTLLYDRARMPAAIQSRDVRTSFIQWLPYAAHYKRVCLPLYPLATRLTDLTNYDLVIASSSAWVHGVRVGPKTVLVCYCYTPFRFIWSHYDSLVAERAGPLRPAIDRLRRSLQKRDLRAAARVDRYIAISRVVQTRIANYYGRESSVIVPPVNLDTFQLAREEPGNYFLIVSALMRYKRLDIAIGAFTRLGLPLKVVGRGEDEARLRAHAGANVEFLGQQTDEEVARLYKGCKAFVFTADEDYGIAPLEAMASGRPVFAFAAGGALETVVDGVTGLFYHHQTQESLIQCVTSADYSSFDPVKIRDHALKFSPETFRTSIRAEVEQILTLSREGGPVRR